MYITYIQCKHVHYFLCFVSEVNRENNEVKVQVHENVLVKS